MARLCAVANGNNTSASTWAVIDPTSYLEAETNSYAVQTSYPASSTMGQFTPGAITVDAMAVRIVQRQNTVGTYSMELYNHTDAVSVVEVTINMSDVQDATSSSINDGGWLLLKFSPVTLIAGKAYVLRHKTSSTNQLTIFNGGSASTITRFLRTTTTQAPVAGDDRFVMGEWTGAGSMTTRTVTLDDTTNTDYGSGSTSAVTPALSISNGGIVLGGTTASTNYIQKISGHVIVYNGGIFRIGTSGSRMPTTSSFTINMDCVANGDFGIVARRKGEFTCYGESKQRWTLLTADKASTATVITVTSTSGWKAGDSLLFGSTSTTASQAEIKTIASVDSSTQVTLSAGLTNAHTGTGDLQGECCSLTSNITINGVSGSVGTYVTAANSSNVVLDNITMQFFGGAGSGKRGVESQHNTSGINGLTVNSCALRDFSNAGATVGSTATNSSLYTITNNVLINSSNVSGHISVLSGVTSSVFDISSNVIMNSANTGVGFNTSNVTVNGTTQTVNNNRISGFTTGITLSGSLSQDGLQYLSGNIVHTCGTGYSSTGTQNKTFNSCTFIYCTNGISTSHNGKTVFNSCNFYGNTTTGIIVAMIQNAPIGRLEFNNCNLRGTTSTNQPSGLNVNVGDILTDITFNSCNFGNTVAHTTADIILASMQQTKMIFNNCNLASTTEITANPWTFIEDYYIGFQRKDTTAGGHTTYIKQGVVTPDTTIYRTASPSLRITPKSATTGVVTTKLFSWQAPINSGQTCTPVVYVRESESGDGATYNGNRVKLYVKANYNLGITSDTLLATATSASDGAWEALTGTTASVTDAGVLEFYVVLDGTAGWVNLEDFSATTA